MKQGIGAITFCVCLAIGFHARCATLPGACGDDTVKLDISVQNRVLPAANAESATVVFVQRLSEACVGCSITRVGFDGAWIGADNGNSFFSAATAPGEHHVCAYWEAPLAKIENRIGLMDFEALAGKIYYFEIEVGPRGEDIPVMRLKPISGDMGAYLVSRSRQSVATPKAR
jgi:hypothetical protein